jgi:hypothetical protein
MTDDRGRQPHPADDRRRQPNAADDRRPLATGAGVLELARIAWSRVVRSNALWVVLAIAALPTLLGVVIAADGHETADKMWRIVFEAAQPLLVVVPPVLVASAIADELEDKTSAYLWSRALPRWTVVIGKLLVLAPLTAIMLGGAALAGGLAAGLPLSQIGPGVIGMGAAGAAAACIAAAIATLLPRHAVAMTMAWMVVVDYPLHLLEFGVRHLSTGFGATAIGGFAKHAGAVSGGLTLAVLSAIAIALACWRIGKVE